ncbi:MAG: hypothetical protein WDZ63_09630 [Burkholderiales bacterium]
MSQLRLQANAAGASIARPEEIFRELWDTQNRKPGLELGAHCDDEIAEDGVTTTLNDFPLSCRPGEGGEATSLVGSCLIDEYKPIALVNRLDLAHEGWRNCGEHRIVYGKVTASGQKNFIIFEAVLPNPKPGCRESCLPVAQFWGGLSNPVRFPSPSSRAHALERFFYEGLPGFRPVVHVNHYSAAGVTGTYGSSGSGQIRTNQFLQSPWLLKEFKVALDCGVLPCAFDLVPVMVKTNPFGEQWTSTIERPHGAAFRADLLLQIAGLSSSDLMKISYSVDLDHDAVESDSQTPGRVKDDYVLGLEVTGNTFVSELQARLTELGISLTPSQIAGRALANSCAGCHMPQTFKLNISDPPGTPSLIGPANLPGGGVTDTWPLALGFVHVDGTEGQLAELPGPVYGPSMTASGNIGHPISPALKDVFLPDREQFLIDQLNGPECACRRLFRGVSQSAVSSLVRLQDQMLGDLSSRIKTEQLAIAGIGKRAPLSKEQLADLETRTNRLRELVAEEIKAVDAALIKRGAPSDSLRMETQVLKLKARTNARGDATKERVLRRQEIFEIEKQEPPRRTVTGSFRTH